MRRILSKLQQQRGQVVILFVGLFTVITAIGVITVDFGLWMSERRGAQTDADLVALAGARECMLEIASDGAYTPDVAGAVNTWFTDNNEAGNAVLVDPPAACESFNGMSCVRVKVQHTSKALFGQIFKQIAPDIGARAIACAGAVNSPNNVIPIDTYTTCEGEPGPCFNANGTPKFGELCGLEFGAHGPGTCSQNPRGILDLDAPPGYCSAPGGSGAIEDLIRDGSPGVCWINTSDSCAPGKEWYDCAATQTGNPQKVLDGFNARVTKNHICDDNYHDSGGVNNVDDLSESVVPMSLPPPQGQSGIFQPRDCDPNTSDDQISQRLVSIIVFEDYPGSNNTGYPISAFGGFYIKGCTKTVEDCVDPNYNWSVNDLNCDMHGQIGHAVVCGEFLRLIVAGSAVGPVNTSSTSFGVALVDWDAGAPATPAPTVAPTSPPPPTIAPTTPPVATSTPVPPTVAPTSPPPPTATPCPCGTKPNGDCKKC